MNNRHTNLPPAKPDLKSRELAYRLARVESRLNALPERVLGASEIEKLYGPHSIRRDIQAGGRTPLHVGQLLGTLSQGQLAISPSTLTLSTDPSLKQDGLLVTYAGAQYRYNSRTQSFEPITASANLLVGTDASRLALTITAANNGLLFISSDTEKLWQVQAGSWVDITPWPPAIETITVLHKSTNYTMASTDGAVLADASGGPITITLPDATVNGGKTYTVKRVNSGANGVTVNTGGGQTIDGAASEIISIRYASISALSDGINYYIV